MFVLVTGCGGGSADTGVSEHHLYGQKRMDCEKTKTTDESANITQCSKIRPDAK